MTADCLPLHAVAKFLGGGTPSKAKEAFWNGSIPWVSPKDMKKPIIADSQDRISIEAVHGSAAKLIPEGAALVVVRSGILTRTVPVSLAGKPLTINQDLKAVVPSKRLDDRYLYYFLLASEAQLLRAVTRGATVHRLSTDAIKNLTIPVPSLVEQRRIVALLDEAFAGIATATANADKNLANARELFEADLETSFAIEAQSHRESTLSELIKITHGFAFKGSDFEASSDPSLPVVLTPGNYTESAELDLGNQKTKRYKRGAVPSEYLFNEGDLTVVMTDLSSKMKILGLPAFVEGCDVLHNQRIGRVVPCSDEVPLRLIYYFMQTRGHIDRVKATATGTMVRHTAPKRLLESMIRIPNSQYDQLMVVERLDGLKAHVADLQRLQRAKIDLLSELKSSILAKAFSVDFTSTKQAVAA